MARLIAESDTAFEIYAKATGGKLSTKSDIIDMIQAAKLIAGFDVSINPGMPYSNKAVEGVTESDVIVSGSQTGIYDPETGKIILNKKADAQKKASYQLAEQILRGDRTFGNEIDVESSGEPNAKYTLAERGVSLNEQSGDNLLYENSEREYNESTRKQTERISSYKRSLEGKTAAERQSVAKELREKGLAEEKINDIHKYNLVKPEAYNEDMHTIVEEAKADGKDVGFFIGAAQIKFNGHRSFQADAIKFSDGKILLRYDGEYAPQTLLKHEDVHINWSNPKMQKLKDMILSGISDAEKKRILSGKRYKEYLDLYKGDVEKVWEEFIADIFAGMNDYAEDYIDVVANYYYDGKNIDRYSPSEYNKITDAGGDPKIVDNTGLGSEYSLSEYISHLILPKQEYAMVSKAIMAKNAGIEETELKPVDYVYAADEFYIYENHSNGDFTVICKFDTVADTDNIKYVKEYIRNGTYTDRKGLNRWVNDIRSRRRSDTWDNVRSENGRESVADDRLPTEQFSSNTVGYSSRVGEDSEIKYAFERSDATTVDNTGLGSENSSIGAVDEAFKNTQYSLTEKNGVPIYHVKIS